MCPNFPNNVTYVNRELLQDIKEYTRQSLRDIFAYTPQKSLLFKGSIKENLEFDKIEKSNKKSR